MELHILGPAFGLSSIDAECCAAVALMSRRYGSDAARWTITIAHTAIETLPMLVDGSTKISGYSNICHHLRASSNTSASADGIALTSLIHARAPALVSAYLYLSYENYSTTTRPAFTPILPLYARFIVPGRLRAAAKEQTAQLGISNLDIEQLDAEGSQGERSTASKSAFDATTPDRPSLILPKAKTVRSLLAQKPENMAAFKLRGLADALFEPLQTMLGQSNYFSGKSEPGSVDCLAYAYLSLMLNPQVPQPWLRNIIQEHYPGLKSYVQRMSASLALDTHITTTCIPPTALSVTEAVLAALQAQTPFFEAQTVERRRDTPTTFVSRHISSLLILAGTTLISSAIWSLWSTLSTARGNAIQIFGQRTAPGFTHIAAALSGMDFLAAAPGYSHIGREPHITNDDALPARVGVEIES